MAVDGASLFAIGYDCGVDVPSLFAGDRRWRVVVRDQGSQEAWMCLRCSACSARLSWLGSADSARLARLGWLGSAGCAGVAAVLLKAAGSAFACW